MTLEQFEGLDRAGIVRALVSGGISGEIFCERRLAARVGGMSIHHVEGLFAACVQQSARLPNDLVIAMLSDRRPDIRSTGVKAFPWAVSVRDSELRAMTLDGFAAAVREQRPEAHFLATCVVVGLYSVSRMLRASDGEQDVRLHQVWEFVDRGDTAEAAELLGEVIDWAIER